MNKPSKKEIIKEYDRNLDLFEQTPEGERECVEYTADRMGITARKVEIAIWH